MKNQLSLHRNRKPQRLLRSAAFLALFILFSIFTTACDKETPLAVDEPSKEQEENVINLEPTKFAYRGQLYPKEEFQRLFKNTEFPVMVTGTGLPEENIVYVFDSEAHFSTWANTTVFSEKLAYAREQALEAKQKTDLNKPSHIGGWLRLYDGIINGATCPPNNGKFLATFVLSDLNFFGFRNKASSLYLYNPPFNPFPAYTICSLYTTTNFAINGGLQIIFINSSSGSTLKIKLTDYLFWSNEPESFIVL